MQLNVGSKDSCKSLAGSAWHQQFQGQIHALTKYEPNVDELHFLGMWKERSQLFNPSCICHELVKFRIEFPPKRLEEETEIPGFRGLSFNNLFHGQDL